MYTNQYNMVGTKNVGVCTYRWNTVYINIPMYILFYVKCTLKIQWRYIRK